jgi:hypothetical protein
MLELWNMLLISVINYLVVFLRVLDFCLLFYILFTFYFILYWYEIRAICSTKHIICVLIILFDNRVVTLIYNMLLVIITLEIHSMFHWMFYKFFCINRFVYHRSSVVKLLSLWTTYLEFKSTSRVDILLKSFLENHIFKIPKLLILCPFDM